MKKIFVFFCCFASMVLMISCGGEEDCRSINGNMWSSLAPTELVWAEADDYCNNLNECGHSDWYLPTISELRTLFKNCPEVETGGSCKITDECLSTYCDNEDCFMDREALYIYSRLGDKDIVLWSSSKVSNLSHDEFWVAIFSLGRIYRYSARGYSGIPLTARCVRNAD